MAVTMEQPNANGRVMNRRQSATWRGTLSSSRVRTRNTNSQPASGRDGPSFLKKSPWDWRQPFAMGKGFQGVPRVLLLALFCLGDGQLSPGANLLALLASETACA